MQATPGEQLEVAAKYVGCHWSTITRTADRDASFGKLLMQAETSHEVLHLKAMLEAAKDARYWRAAAWVLERMYPNRYGARKAGQITPDQIRHLLDQFASIVLDEMESVQERSRVIARLEELLAELPPSAEGTEPQAEAESDES